MKCRGEEGIALVITLLVMTILLMMGSAFLSISSTETLISINERNRVQAFHLAEAAAERAIAELNIDGTYQGSGGEQPLGFGTYNVTVCPPNCVPPATPPANPNQQLITATGCVRDCTTPSNAVANVSMVVERGSPFDFGLLGLTLVELDGNNIEVDSYDSTQGDYGADLGGGILNVGSDGDVHSNGDITLDTNDTVHGDARAVGAISKGAGSTITGSETTGVPPESVVTDPNCPTPGGYVTGINPPAAYDGASYDLTAGVGQTVTLDPGTYAFNRITLNDGAKLAVNGPVVICMTGQFKAYDGAVINTSKIPENLFIFSSYSGTDGSGTDAMHMVPGSGEFYGGIYALDGEVEFQNGGWQIYGAIVAKHIDIETDGRFHYDVSLALSPNNPAGKFKPIAGSWREVVQ